MSDTSTRLPEEAPARLDRHKRVGESYADVILRLTERDPWAGFGSLAGSEQDTREAMERVRDETREGIRNDVYQST
ncbi:MAG: antitoxin VapB family protein [Haloarculaceae archaeon]